MVRLVVAFTPDVVTILKFALVEVVSRKVGYLRVTTTSTTKS